MTQTVRVKIVRDGGMCFIPVPFDPKAVFGKVRAPVKVTLNDYTTGVGSVARVELLAPAGVRRSDRGSSKAGDPGSADRGRRDDDQDPARQETPVARMEP